MRLSYIGAVVRDNEQSFFVDFGTTRFAATAHDEYRRLFTAHELPHDAVDQALFDQAA